MDKKDAQITLFLGKPITYWEELDAYARANMYDKLIEKIVKLEAENKELKKRRWDDERYFSDHY